MPRAINFEEDGIQWSGQTIGDSDGMILFGKDSSGALWLEIREDFKSHITAHRAMYPDGAGIASVLSRWFNK